MKTAILLRSPRDEENIISPRVARVPPPWTESGGGMLTRLIPSRLPVL